MDKLIKTIIKVSLCYGRRRDIPVRHSLTCCRSSRLVYRRCTCQWLSDTLITRNRKTHFRTAPTQWTDDIAMISGNPWTEETVYRGNLWGRPISSSWHETSDDNDFPRAIEHRKQCPSYFASERAQSVLTSFAKVAIYSTWWQFQTYWRSTTSLDVWSFYCA